MKKHQKCFTLEDGKGNIKPNFITVSNLESTEPEKVIAGNERWLRWLEFAPEEWGFLLYLAATPAVQKEAAALLFAATRDEHWKAGKFDFRDPVTGSAQIGTVMGWLMSRLDEGWDETSEREQQLTEVLDDETRLATLIRLADRRTRVMSEKLGVKYEPVTAESIKQRISLVGPVLGEATDVLLNGAHTSPAKWRAWVRGRERSIDLLESLRTEEPAPKPDAGSLGQAVGATILTGILLGGVFGVVSSTLSALLASRRGTRETAAIDDSALRVEKAADEMSIVDVPTVVTAIAAVRRFEQAAQLSGEVAQISVRASRLEASMEGLLAGLLFGKVTVEEQASVQIFDLAEGLITLNDLSEAQFMADYFGNSKQHELVLIVSPDEIEAARQQIANAVTAEYQNRVSVIAAANLQQGIVAAQTQFRDTRLVVNTVQDERVTRDQARLFEISSERGVLGADTIRKLIVLGGRNVALNGYLAGAISEAGFMGREGQYLRVRMDGLAKLLETISFDAEAEALRARSA